MKTMSVAEYRKISRGQAPARGQGASKYRNVKVTIDTHFHGRVTFDSTAESHRYLYHERRLMSGEQFEIELQPEFKLVVNDVRICNYRADFRLTYPDGRVVIEDVKGKVTPEYSIKRKLVQAIYGIEIVEIHEGVEIVAGSKSGSKRKKRQRT